MQIAIVDYGMGNLRSVMNAFKIIGCMSQIAHGPDELNNADRIVLPGVGAFGDGMFNLRNGGWVEAMEEQVRSKGKPFLGLCLGMQLIATTGTEYGVHAGLNWIRGTVERITSHDTSLRIPHVGWNDVRFINKRGMYSGLVESQSFYFIHSYVLRAENPEIISGICEYGSVFPASIEVDNIWATQYHPEKSQKAGLKVLENFVHCRF